MLDNRIHTFLELCTQMNYHKTAEILNMTQPAVTQHIKYLENFYNCELFKYSNKKLSKTAKCLELETKARSIVALCLSAEKTLAKTQTNKINIGATKTIGEYAIDEKILNLFSRKDFEIRLIIDNTKNLLNKLDTFELDLLMLEGYIDKTKYEHRLISTEEIVGICALNHPFAGKKIELDTLFAQNIVLREEGSGTRAVFENFLQKQGYSTNSFTHKSVVSSNKIIELIVENAKAISFVYSVIPDKNKNLATFKIKDNEIFHEFNYVYLKNTAIENTLKLL